MKKKFSTSEAYKKAYRAKHRIAVNKAKKARIKRWKERKTSIVFVKPIAKKPEPVEPIDETFLEIIDEYCNEFRCNKKLTLLEKLCGKKCIEHQNLKPEIFYNGKL